MQSFIQKSKLYKKIIGKPMISPRLQEKIMSFTSVFFVITATSLFHLIHFSSAGSNETDWQALHEIKAKLSQDPLGVLNSWNHSVHFCQWYGVSCGPRHLRVTVLDLQSLKLTGNLSPWIGNLSFLRVLQLQNNSFSGTIPSQIGHLHRLKTLIIYNNSFGGEIPTNISSCSSLTQLDISNNRLVGRIPRSIGKLTKLKILIFFENKLTGSIPSSLGNLSSLIHFSVRENNLVGRIPSSLGKLKDMIFFSSGENNLEGVVPPSIFNLSVLEALNLGRNKLEGTLPSDLGNTLPNLSRFSIADNNYTGHIPVSISNASNLVIFQLPGNNLRGEVPSLHKLKRLQVLIIYKNFLGIGQPTDMNFVSSLSNVTMIKNLQIGDNNFGGLFPRSICNFTELQVLIISANKIAGDFPTCIENLANLQILDIEKNQVFGHIPTTIGKLKNLYDLNIGDNKFSGNIPSTIRNLTLLTMFLAHANSLEGYIPSGLGNCVYLIGLDLSENNLSGSIPSQLLSISSLSLVLNLGNNYLTGSLPDAVGNLKNLVQLEIYNNMLTGEIPRSLSSCVELAILDISGNRFQGKFPQSLEALKSLVLFNMSSNNFSGRIPNFITSLPLQQLNMSYNQFEGEVPTGGVLNYANNVSLIGNKGLCGGIPELKLPHCSLNQNRRPDHVVKLTIGIVSGIIGVLFLVIICVISYLFCYKNRTPNPPSSGDSKNFPNLSFQMLQKATNRFSEENLIGSGTFGVVYKGIFDDESTVAIKIFKLEFVGAFKSFMDECGVLRNIRHRNLVKMITACSSLDYQGRDFKALVYEYMSNGSLEDWLHPSSEAMERNLNLWQRLDIVVDVAIALEYLHYHCGACVVHCDLKPSNILLSDDLVAHVSDFGLAKFLPQGIINNSQENQSSSIGVRGTIGYTPPEYGLGNEVSTSGDAYSFGILLLEMFTRMRPTNDMFKGGQSLHNFVKEALPERVLQIVDHALLDDIVGEGSDSNVRLEAIISVLGVALSCSTDVPQDRLNMSDTVRKLSSLKKTIVETQPDHRRRRI